MCFCFFKQKTAYEMRISDWSSDVCSSDLHPFGARQARRHVACAVERDRRIAVAMHDQCRYRDARQLFADVVAADQSLETAHPIVGLPATPFILPGRRAGPHVAEHELCDGVGDLLRQAVRRTGFEIGTAMWRERVVQKV